jgi:hypothetical protein
MRWVGKHLCQQVLATFTKCHCQPSFRVSKSLGASDRVGMTCCTQAGLACAYCSRACSSSNRTAAPRALNLYWNQMLPCRGAPEHQSAAALFHAAFTAMQIQCARQRLLGQHTALHPSRQSDRQTPTRHLGRNSAANSRHSHLKPLVQHLQHIPPPQALTPRCHSFSPSIQGN